MRIKSLRILFAACAAMVFVATPALAEEAPVGGGRVMAVSLEAVVTDVDYETRQLSLRGPQGNIITLTAGDHIERLEDIAVGDSIVTTYIASLEVELREPTEEEIANPWVELDGAATAPTDSDPGAIIGRTIRAVCTIEGLNRVIGTVTILDPRGKYHVIGDVEPEKMAGVTLGTTVVVVYSEAMAITLDKQLAAE